MKLNSFFLLVMISASITACGQKIKKTGVSLQKTDSRQLTKYAQATFAAGCFWHEEAMFESVKGVKEAISGYAGGTTTNPTYESIESGNTGHAETVNVYYDSSVISFPTLVKLYFAGQDPTQVNGQGPDRGTQYRSIVFYRNNAEKSMIDNAIKTLNASHKFRSPVAAQVMPFTRFWEAEDYHQDYIQHNPDGGYVQNVSIPEIKKLQKDYPQLIKPDHIY
ncbi:MAG: peptide-methionine (S)-S-oxide reductase MsrA [Ginsengibacter sp.]